MQEIFFYNDETDKSYQRKFILKLVEMRQGNYILVSLEDITVRDSLAAVKIEKKKIASYYHLLLTVFSD